MKFRFLFVAALGASLLAPGTVRAQPQNDPPKLPLRLENAGVDEALLGLARQAKVNIIADADGLPRDKTITTTAPLYNLVVGDWLGILSHQFGLTWHDRNSKDQWGDWFSTDAAEKRDYVVWREPEVEPLVRRLAKELVPLSPPGAGQAAAPAAGAPAVQRHELYNEQVRRLGADLAAWLRTQGWDGQSPDFQRDFKLSELPEPLRVSLRRWLFTSISIAFWPEVRWLDDATWQRARILLPPRDPREDRHAPLHLVAKADFDGVEKAASVTYIFKEQAINEQARCAGGRAMAPRPVKLKWTPPLTMLRCALPGGALLAGSRAAGAQQPAAQQPAEPPAPAAPTTAPAQPAQGADDAKIADGAGQWRSDAGLDGGVTLEAKRMPLADVLKSFGKQSGATLDGGAFAARPVTLGVRDMSLRDAMSVLERLYDATWQRTGDRAYALQAVDRPDWQKQLARMGCAACWGYWRDPFMRQAAPPYLSLDELPDWPALIAEVGVEKLQAPEGVAFADLPEHVQSALRHAGRFHQLQHGLREFAEQYHLLEVAQRDYLTVRVKRNGMTQGLSVEEMQGLPPLAATLLDGNRPLNKHADLPATQPAPAEGPEEG